MTDLAQPGRKLAPEVQADLERIGGKLAAEVIRALADYLDKVDAPCRSEVVLHHGPEGVVQAADGRRISTVLDVRPPKGVKSR